MRGVPPYSGVTRLELIEKVLQSIDRPINDIYSRRAQRNVGHYSTLDMLCTSDQPFEWTTDFSIMKWYILRTTKIDSDYITRIFGEQPSKRDRTAGHMRAGHFKLSTLSMAKMVTRDHEDDQIMMQRLLESILCHHRKVNIIGLGSFRFVSFAMYHG